MTSPIAPNPNLVGLTGLSRAGKDTAAWALVQDGYMQIRFADCIKDMIRLLLRYRGMHDRDIERHIEGDLKEHPCEYLNGRSTRYAMQTLGTEWGRDIMSKNLWADATLDRCLALRTKVVVSDVRFRNEYDKMKQAGALIIHIDRSNLSVDTHPSETGIKDLPYDAFVYNNGTIADLHSSVRLIVKQYKSPA